MKSAARKAAPKKKSESHYSAYLGAAPKTGERLWVHMFVIPDHWKITAQRWTAKEERNIFVESRSNLAKAFRRWREEGGRPDRGQEPFAALMAYFVKVGLDAVEQRKGAQA